MADWVLFGGLAVAIGFLLGWSTARVRTATLAAELAAERSGTADKIALLQDAENRLRESFKVLSDDALRNNHRSFLDLATATLGQFQESARGDVEKRRQAISDLVTPVRESLERFDARVREIEKSRTGAYASLTQQVSDLQKTQSELRSETANLVKALRAPAVRGRWGEIQLRRVVELAGMLHHCDFFEQQTATTEAGRFRPDLIVKLAGGRNIVVDAKAPLSSYLDALEAGDEATRLAKLRDHARQIRAHLSALARKEYWDQFPATPEFVVLFLPSEAFFSAALEQDPSLIEVGASERVILATPTTLIALFRAVAYGWKQDAIARNAQDISDLGRQLYRRLSDLGEHWCRVGKSLGNAVEAYNRAVGTLEARVLVTARKFEQLEATPAGNQLAELLPLERAVRRLEADELAGTAPRAAAAGMSAAS